MQTEINVYADQVNQISLYAVSGEYNSREFIFNVIEKDGTQLTNSNAEVINKMLDLTGYIPRLYILKPDNTVSFIEGNLIDAVSGKISFTLSSQSVAAAGVSECNIILTSDNKDLRIIGINLTVNKSIINDNAIESSNDFPALQTALFTVSQYDNRIKAVEGRADVVEEHLLNLDDRITPIEKGGTGASTADGAREALGAAPISHNHTFADLSDILSVDKGGTGATTAAEAFTALSEDTGWFDISYGDNYERFANAYAPLRCRKIGPLVQIRGTVKRKTSLSNVSSIEELGTIPDGFRPQFREHTLYVMSGNNLAGGYIKSGGEICLTWTHESAPINTDSWISIRVDYFI